MLTRNSSVDKIFIINYKLHNAHSLQQDLFLNSVDYETTYKKQKFVNAMFVCRIKIRTLSLFNNIMMQILIRNIQIQKLFNIKEVCIRKVYKIIFCSTISTWFKNSEVILGTIQKLAYTTTFNYIYFFEP